MDVDRSQIGTFRDDRGNSVLHLSCIHNKLECMKLLVDELGMNVNLRDAKGWTPIAMAAFHGHKQICRELMGRKADASIANAYRKDAHDVAKDDEIKEVLSDQSLWLNPGLQDAGEAPVEASSTAAG